MATTLRRRGLPSAFAVLMLILTTLSHPGGRAAARGLEAPDASGGAQIASTRDTAIARAKAWVDAAIPYNQRRWYQGYREDCSGYVSMAWQLDKSYTTYTLGQVFQPISKDELLPGDILNNSDGGGNPDFAHVLLFDSWVDSAHTHYNAYEENPYWGGAHYTTNIPYPFWKGYYNSQLDYVPMRLKAPSPVTTPPLAHLTVYMGTGGPAVIALNADTGAERWRSQVFSAGTSVTLANGVLYVGAAGGPNPEINEYAIRAADGTVLWHYEAGGVVGAATVANGTIYFGSDDHNIYALNAANGALRWSFQTGDEADDKPTVSNGVVYAGSCDGFEYALNANTGKELWRFQAQNCVDAEVVGNGLVYVTTSGYDSHVYALNASDGTLVWIHDNGPNNTTSSPVIVGGLVCFSDSDHVVALDATTGAARWQFHSSDSFSESIDQGPAVDGGELFVGSYRGHVYALDAADGALRWSYQGATGILSGSTIMEGEIFGGSPVVADGEIYLAGTSAFITDKLNANVYAINESDGTLHWMHAIDDRGDSASGALAVGN